MESGKLCFVVRCAKGRIGRHLHVHRDQGGDSDKPNCTFGELAISDNIPAACCARVGRATVSLARLPAQPPQDGRGYPREVGANVNAIGRTRCADRPRHPAQVNEPSENLGPPPQYPHRTDHPIGYQPILLPVGRT
jgi:hypothetical protein